MLAGSLPHLIDAQKWADREGEIDQVFPLAAFPRVREGAVSDAGEIKVHCKVSRNTQGLMKLDAELGATVQLACQRCLEPVTCSVQSTVSIFLLRSEEIADQLSDDADFLVLDEEGRFVLLEALEDELILSLPLVPVHESCDALQIEATTDDDVVEEPARENPFQVLAALKGHPEEK